METETETAVETTETNDDLDAKVAAWRAEDRRRYTRLRAQARASVRAMDGWVGVKDRAHWLTVVDEARFQYHTGRFLIERLGAERFLDPHLMATLWSMRQMMIEDLGAQSTHELMLVDIAVISYYHMLRFQGWIGDFALHIEHEFFTAESPTAKFAQRHGYAAAEGLKVEDHIERVGEQLLPLMDRSQRMFIRALRELRRPVPGLSQAVAIGQAGQVNVGAVQTNSVESAAKRIDRRRSR